MNPYIQNQQIEELVWVDPYDSLAEDSTIMDEEEYSYDDASFGELMSSGNDF